MRFLGSVIWGACVAAACAPALDWRELHAEGTALAFQLPCRPGEQSRSLRLTQRTVPMRLSACQAGGLSFSLAWADVADPGATAAALAELAASAQSSLQAKRTSMAPAQVPGMTPNPAAMRIRLNGRRPDGEEVAAELVVFVHGTWIFQAAVIGQRLPGPAIAQFIDALRLQP